jgi:hypothetical protein
MYSELHPSLTLPGFTTDQLLSPTIEPVQYPIQVWHKTLIRCHKAEGSRPFVVESMEHHKQPCRNLQDEFILLRVAPAGGIDEETCNILIGRTIEGLPRDSVSVTRQNLLSQLGVQGPAIDWVTVLPRGDHGVILQQPLSSISWCGGRMGWFAPRLLALSGILRHISIVEPNYNIPTTQCCWFARAAYSVISAIFGVAHCKREWDKHWDLSPVSRFGTIPRMTSHPTCAALRTVIAYHSFVLDGYFVGSQE